MTKPRWWLGPVLVCIVAILFLVLPQMFFFMLPSERDRLAVAAKKQRIQNYTIETTAGPILVTTIRSGTEFTRILQLPNQQAFIEAGWVNSWGEEQVRMIGPQNRNN